MNNQQKQCFSCLSECNQIRELQKFWWSILIVISNGMRLSPIPLSTFVIKFMVGITHLCHDDPWNQMTFTSEGETRGKVTRKAHRKFMKTVPSPCGTRSAFLQIDIWIFEEGQRELFVTVADHVLQSVMFGAEETTFAQRRFALCMYAIWKREHVKSEDAI